MKERHTLPSETAIGYQLRLTSEQLRARLQERLAPLGVRLTQFQYLRVLWESDGISQKTLSDRVARMGPNTAAALNILERDGFVMRKPSPTDGRVTNVFLTPKARRMQTKIASAASEVIEASLAGLKEKDAEALLVTLKLMQHNLARMTAKEA